MLENKHSYTDFMREVSRNSSSIQAERLLNDIYMDLFLTRIHRDQIIGRLLCAIDQALDSRDEKAFLTYTTQLNKLQNRNDFSSSNRN